MLVYLLGIVIVALAVFGASLFDHRVVRKCHNRTMKCWVTYVLFAFAALVWSLLFSVSPR